MCKKNSSPVPDHELNARLGRSLQGLVGLVYAPASTVLPVDLKDLVAKTQPSQGRRGVSLHQLDKHSLREETDKALKNESKNGWREDRQKADTDSGEKTKQQLKRKEARGDEVLIKRENILLDIPKSERIIKPNRINRGLVSDQLF